MGHLLEEPHHVVIEIENRKCKCRETLRTLGIRSFKVIDVRKPRGGPTRHLVKIPPEEVEKIRDTDFAGVELGGKAEREISRWFESEGCKVCNTMLSQGSFLVSGRGLEDSGFLYSFVAPNFHAFRNIVSTLETDDLRPKVLRVEKYEMRLGKILTAKQERVLWLASRMGFFDYPRRITISELAGKLGIGPSTLSEIIRRGTRRLLDRHFSS